MTHHRQRLEGYHDLVVFDIVADEHRNLHSRLPFFPCAPDARGRSVTVGDPVGARLISRLQDIVLRFEETADAARIPAEGVLENRLRSSRKAPRFTRGNASGDKGGEFKPQFSI